MAATTRPWHGEGGQMADSKVTTEEVTITYIINQESWWQVIAETTLELIDECDADSAMLDQVLTDIGSAEQANLNTITAIQSRLSSANLK
jgi:hypothetical protein